MLRFFRLAGEGLLWLILVLTILPRHAEARSLYWRSLEVACTLDAQGRLHVRETHEMVFDGEWNGGERDFRVQGRQELTLESLVEIDPTTGARIEYDQGGLDRVGEYKWFGDHVLRWRVRLPSDPPFRSDVRTFVLDYVLTQVVERSDSAYVLDHDFAFPDRSGEIVDFRAELALDPAWRVTRDDLELPLRRANLAPGQSVVRRIELEYLGAGQPSGVAGPLPLIFRPGSTGLKAALLAALAVLCAVCVLATRNQERRRGRFEPLIPAEAIDARWLEEHVFRDPPEVIGAAWDRTTSSYEVAAVLARMAAEGKVATRVESSGVWIFRRDVLHMTLQVEASSLAGYERRLVNALFLGERSTDTDRIRAHYRSSGFDPVKLIRTGLEAKVRARLGSAEGLQAWRWLATAGALTFGAVLCIIGVIAVPESAPALVFGFAAILVPALFAKVFAIGYRETMHDIGSQGVRLAVAVLALLGAWGALLVMSDLPLITLQVLGLSLLAGGALNSISNAAWCRESIEAVRRRKELAAGRRFFERELRAQNPRLSDDWFPYLLAFGLGPDVDKWFRAHGARTPGPSRGLAASAGRSGGAGASASAWTGGGGSFGGAGATGSWVSAIGGIAAGVSPPSSSGSSGGGGGGGSSGGGGGGGW